MRWIELQIVFIQLGSYITESLLFSFSAHFWAISPESPGYSGR